MMQHAYTGESSSGEDLVFIKAFFKKKYSGLSFLVFLISFIIPFKKFLKKFQGVRKIWRQLV